MRFLRCGGALLGSLLLVACAGQMGGRSQGDESGARGEKTGAQAEKTDAQSESSPAQGETSSLEGTSWQLVEFRGGDDSMLKPDDSKKYTIAFAPGGQLSARIDCNRGRGTWISSAPGRLELGPLALTRAMCPPGSLHDQIARQWQYVRSYLVRDGHLFLSLMVDGGIYEFEPAAQ